MNGVRYREEVDKRMLEFCDDMKVFRVRLFRPACSASQLPSPIYAFLIHPMPLLEDTLG